MVIIISAISDSDPQRLTFHFTDPKCIKNENEKLYQQLRSEWAEKVFNIETIQWASKWVIRVWGWQKRLDLIFILLYRVIALRSFQQYYTFSCIQKSDFGLSWSHFSMLGIFATLSVMLFNFGKESRTFKTKYTLYLI